MTAKYELRPEQLINACNLEDLAFETTKDIKLLEGIIGQNRGIEALRFGLRMRQHGYNIFVTGESGTGRSSFTYSLAEEYAKEREVPNDWIYVYNFKNKDVPRALSLSPGTGRIFKNEIDLMIENFRKYIPEVFESKEYESKKNDIYRLSLQKKNKILKRMNEKSAKLGFAYITSEEGLVSVPLVDSRPMSEEEYQNLSIEEKEELMLKYDELQQATYEEFNDIRELEQEIIKNVNQLDKSVISELVNFEIQKLMDKYADNDAVIEYLQDLKEDVMANINKFKNPGDVIDIKEKFFVRYKVNLFVDNSHLDHAPIIKESNPIYNNLVGDIEYDSYMGVLTTDFTKIKPGSLHLANGGYLIFQIKEILSDPVSWEMIKRALKTNEINIESFNKLMGLAVTSSLKPEPIPLDIKIIIVGDELTYGLLYQYDEDFRKLFKVMCAFDNEMVRDKKNVQLMAQFIASHCEQNNLRHFHSSAVGKVVEFSSRMVEHQDKLSTRFNKIVEILYEADFWAQEDNANIVTAKHVQMAIDKKIYRSNRYEEKLYDMFLEDSILLDVHGEKVGQINGLAVLGTGEYSFGKPSRITASVYCGNDKVINIERESKQSGNIHDKGVLILSGYLGEKYAMKRPLGLTIGIGFEQSYSIIDGDSASSAELYAILSSMADVPIKQYIAVTGSVNQKGEIQPIGGVNEKIEGFYEICKLKGLNGKQGVIIPKQNIKNLMLKEEVIDAVKNGKFHIYAIEHVEEGIEILMGLKAGKLNEFGEYEEGSLNHRIMERLNSMEYRLQKA
jgi:lon-related putative ATP-dependent protease